ncbi:hypothetical protein RND81_05G032500 [Saponaria officinalis]|uniref:Transposase n=1 Tax=Saponaria officinalis TaxID=3572 RepID=A0AAW1KQ42_SAPOF
MSTRSYFTRSQVLEDDQQVTNYENECGLENEGNDVRAGFDGETSFHSNDEDSNGFAEEEATDNEDEQVNLDNLDLELEATVKEKTRGPTMLHHVHMRSLEKRKSIILNEFGQPIGPIRNEEDTVAEFSRFFGTIARDYSYAPLIIDSWWKVPNKEKIWDYVLMKYMVPTEGKDWVIKTIGAAWRVHKCRFKKNIISHIRMTRVDGKTGPKRFLTKTLSNCFLSVKSQMRRYAARVIRTIASAKRICTLLVQRALQ